MFFTRKKSRYWITVIGGVVFLTAVLLGIIPVETISALFATISIMVFQRVSHSFVFLGTALYFSLYISAWVFLPSIVLRIPFVRLVLACLIKRFRFIRKTWKLYCLLQKGTLPKRKLLAHLIPKKVLSCFVWLISKVPEKVLTFFIPLISRISKLVFQRGTVLTPIVSIISITFFIVAATCIPSLLKLATLWCGITRSKTGIIVLFLSAWIKVGILTFFTEKLLEILL